MTATERPVLNDRYEIQQRIGRGGMADVFLARDRLLDRPVAIKVLFAEYAADPAFVERFRREAQAAANLNHPNIVGVYDWGRFDSTYFIAMEFVAGRTLAEILKANERLTPTQATDVASEVAAALGFAHRNGVVHRDVKPANILIGHDGRVKVADFGIACALNAAAEHDLTQAGTVMGTATYLSPEQAQGAQPDPRSDLYSLGVVLYEMVSGKPPFTGDNPVAIAYKQVHNAPRPLNQIVEGIPRPFEAIIAKLLAKNASVRYPNAEALRDDLRRFKDGQPVGALAALGQGGAPPPAAAAGPASAPRAVPPPAAGPATTSLPPTAVQTAQYAPGYYEAPRRTSGILILSFLALAALIAGAVFLVLGLQDGDGDGGSGLDTVTVTVPEVRGVSIEAAEQILRDAGLEPEAQAVANPDVGVNIVYEQDPTPDQVVQEGSRVILLYNPDASTQLVEMPNLEGLSLKDALAKLVEVGLDPDKVTTEEKVDDSRVAGTVVDQSPARREQVATDTNIILVLAVASAQVEVPELKGLTLAAGTALLEDFGFDVDVEEEVSDEIPAGSIIRTEPADGTMLESGARVVVVVSLGKEQVIVPDLEGFNENQARQALQDLELKTKVGPPIDLPPGDPRDGTVVLQNPGRNTSVDKGATVTIRLGRAAALPSTPPPTPATTTSTTTTTTTTTTSPPPTT